MTRLTVSQASSAVAVSTFKIFKAIAIKIDLPLVFCHLCCASILCD